MNKQLKRWISIMTIACLLAALCPAALAEDADGASLPETCEAVPAEAPGEVAEEAEELFLGLEEAELSPDQETEAAEMPSDITEDAAPLAEADLADIPEAIELVTVSEKPYAYYWTVNAATRVYRDEALTDLIYTLKADEAVLVTARQDGVARAGFNTMDGAVEGYIAAADLQALTEGETENLLNEMSAIGNVALYQGDIDWPLPMAVRGAVLAAADFTRQSNDKEFVVQGKTITARMVGNHSDCWSWARALYNIIWGVKFDNNFVGDATTGISLIRNLTDDERLLTGENLKRFMAQSVPGCTLRIGSCPRSCSNIDNDGCPKHEKHSLIVVEIGAEGFVVMDNVTGNGTDRFDTRYYTYDNFAKHWAKYKMVKYIKWPNAPEFDRTRDSGVKPESVTLSEAGLTIRAGQTQAMTATVLPENAEDRSVTWSSSDPFVAYMGDDGNLVAVAAGTATITAKAVNGVSASADITVAPKDAKATNVTLDQTGTVYLNLGSTLQLNATLEPSWANPEVAWKSSKKKVATVSDTGLVTPVKAGTTVISVVTASKKVAKVKVKVLKGDAVGKVTLDKTGTVTLNMGETLQLNATVSPATAKAAMKWKSSNGKIAKVSSTGLVTPVKAGTATIAVVTSNKKTAKVKVKIQDPNAPSGVTLDQTGAVTLAKGATLQLNATLAPETAATSLKWKSSNKKIAKVSSTGLVTAVKTGACTIAVKTANNKVAKVKVKVVAKAQAEAQAADTQAAETGTEAVSPTGVTLDQTGTVTVKLGQTLQLNATLAPENASAAMAWKSSNKKVAKVSSTGLVTPVKTGTCTVGVVTANKKTAKVKIKVVK